MQTKKTGLGTRIWRNRWEVLAFVAISSWIVACNVNMWRDVL